MNSIIHICASWGSCNGAANIARLLAGRQAEMGSAVSLGTWVSPWKLNIADEVWIHCSWLPCLWRAALWAKKFNWMPEASYDPLRLGYHGWKKRLVSPVERFFLRRAEAVVATCAAEAEWIRAFEPRVKKIEIIDIKQFFDLSRKERKCRKDGEPLHLLYLGRRHPLKGVEYLEAAVAELNSNSVDPVNSVQNSSLHLSTSTRLKAELRIVSSAFGEEKERVWDWCDVLVLPTLSENFGLVVAEALERGKRVITTDGAPAWGDDCKCQIENAKCKISGGEILTGYSGCLLYLKGYRDGTEDERVRLLKCAITFLVSDFASR